MRFRFPLTVGVAISILMVLSLRHIHAASRPAGPRIDGTPRTPVLVELFTSEGCSSCPPADLLLERLDRLQPISGAELIVLSEHVDYWNDIGWKDPYSSHEYSERQSAYAAQFRRGSIYTPQMVVDGHFELVGSDERRAINAIENAARMAKIPLSVSSVRLTDHNTMALHLEIDPLSSYAAAETASVFIAIADDSDESNVSRGENAGRTLKHVSVLRDLVRVGKVDKATGFSRDLNVALNNENPRNLRIVAIVQDTAAGRVWGVGLARPSN